MSKRSIQIKRLKQFLKQEVGNSKQILDIGCGDGATALYLISSLNCTIQGIDLDAGRIHRANEKFKRKPHKGFAICNVFKAEDMNRKFFQIPFNAVIVTHALHHLDNVRKALTKSKNVLTRDGKIIIAEYTRQFGEKVDNCPRFSTEKIKLLVAKAGFRKVKQLNLAPGLFAVIGFKD